MLTNPAALASGAAIMSQIAMQQQMAEITEYLKIIDAKVDHVLRSQTNEVLAGLDGVDLAVREAMSVRDAVGRVSEVTWSKVQNSAQTIHETQGYALRELADLADDLEKKDNIVRPFRGDEGCRAGGPEVAGGTGSLLRTARRSRSTRTRPRNWTRLRTNLTGIA